MGTNAHKLPGLLAEIEAVAGRSAAVTIAATYGGTRKKFPSPEALEKAPGNYTQNWLVGSVGYDLALTIVNELFPIGGQEDIPNARVALRRQYVLDNAALLSNSEIALCLDMTERGVRGIKASLRDEGLIP